MANINEGLGRFYGGLVESLLQKNFEANTPSQGNFTTCDEWKTVQLEKDRIPDEVRNKVISAAIKNRNPNAKIEGKDWDYLDIKVDQDILRTVAMVCSDHSDVSYDVSQFVPSAASNEKPKER